MPNMFPLPHQINMNRPPPSLMPDIEMNQRKAWIHNQSINDQSMCDDGGMSQMSEAPPSLLGIAPPNFMPQNHRGNFPSPGNFRGGNRGGKMIRGGISSNNNIINNNTSPFNNYRGGRGGGIRPRGRGNFRGNFQGQNSQQW